jgi:uncharacterized repeat protein (TIGR03803 family)
MLAALTAALAPLGANATGFQTLCTMTSNQGYGPRQIVFYRGNIFGVAFAGGKNNYGSVFRCDPGSGKLKVLYSFTNGADGGDPFGIAQADGTLYGIIVNGNGNIFSVDPSNGAENTVYNFTNGNDGRIPNNLTSLHGTLYGSTEGNEQRNALFEFNAATGTLTTLYAFRRGNGRDPFGLIPHANSIYGVSDTGEGKQAAGLVFAFREETSKFATLYTFQGGTDGVMPFGLLLVDRTFYGITVEGGSGFGTAYMLNPATRVNTTLHDFQGGTDGAGPEGSLVFEGGLLYGATTQGGNTGCQGNGCGTLYSINPINNTERVLYTFTGQNDGSWPINLIEHEGAVYGVANSEGSNAPGTVFKYTP